MKSDSKKKGCVLYGKHYAGQKSDNAHRLL